MEKTEDSQGQESGEMLFQDYALVTGIVWCAAWGVLCLVALKYHTVGAQEPIRMCTSYSTLLIEKLLKLQGNTSALVPRSHVLLTHFQVVA